MSLPAPVLDLAAEVVPDADEHGKLAFAYAHGALLSGFGGDDELGLVCVWAQDEPPEAASTRAVHVTQDQFDAMLGTVVDGAGWADPRGLPLTEIAAFAYGVLLSDDDGAGTAARGAVSEFPAALAAQSARILGEDRRVLAEELETCLDDWVRADTLSHALYRAYVAWFAASEHYFPGPRRRREYAAHFRMDPEVLHLEQSVWQAVNPWDVSSRYVTMAERILREYR
ncbi:MAG: hypothetical protein ACRDXX_00660 [Stackebrandtia sp.]